MKWSEKDPMGCPSWKYRFFLLAVFCVAYSVLYLLPNFSPFFEPQLLPLSSVDLSTPFLPWTFLIYTSDYLLFACVVVLLNTMESFNAYARMAFIGMVFCSFFFMFYPTTYPRPLYPDVDNWLVWGAMNLVGAADTPNNCFPSMHVAMTALATYALRHKPRRVLVPFCFWAFAIFVSTLTTKQHYLVDIFGGLGVTVVTILVERWITRSIKFPSPKARWLYAGDVRSKQLRS